MKSKGVNISKRDRFLILGIVIVLLILAYNQFFKSPLQARLDNQKGQQDTLQTDINLKTHDLAELKQMKTELDRLGTEDLIWMPSYPAMKEEWNYLNSLLGFITGYDIKFTDLTRAGEQIRRSFSISFTTDTYRDMETVLERLSTSKNRCLIGTIKCSEGRSRSSIDNTEQVVYNINITGTFYETMYGGKVDTDLPPDLLAKK